MSNANELMQKQIDLQQRRADQLEAATKAFNSGDMTSYESAMQQVKAYNTQLEQVDGLLSEHQKAFGGENLPGAGEAEQRYYAAGKTLLDTIRGTKKYADAWLEAMRKGIQPDKGMEFKSLAPLYEAESALKALTIGGGTTPGEEGGFLAPIDFDNKVIELMKEYVDLSTLVNVENVRVNAGWRVVDATGTRTKLPKIGEMGKIGSTKQPSYKRVNYNCEKFGDKLIVSNELLADAPSLIAHLADWWAPRLVMTKNALILEKLEALPFAALPGATDAEQIKALKSLLNTGLNTAHSKRASILTNVFGYDAMDNWVDGNGRALLVPDLRSGGPDKFKNRPVVYADADLIPTVEKEDQAYKPMYVGNLKAFCTLFLRQGTRIRSTDIGGDAWDTDSTEIRCICRMDCQTIDTSAVKFTGFADTAAAAVAEDDGEAAE